MVINASSTPAPELNLAACENEPIRIPGSIQPHGLLIALDASTYAIEQVSANAGPLLGHDTASLLGQDVRKVFGAGLMAILPETPPDERAVYLGPLEVSGAAYHATMFRAAPGTLVLEFEVQAGAPSGSLDTLYPHIREYMERVPATTSLEELHAYTAAEVRRITGFDRVLIYCFDEDWHSTVVGESGNQALPSYLGLRFPAGDIPAQARELYRVNRVRLIPDIEYAPVPLVPALNPQTRAPLDLTYSTLRSVSPVHVQYMRNMGTPSSMSFSIMEDGRLWGLMSCHHAQAKRAPLHIRTACDLIAQVLGMQLSRRARAADALERVSLQSIQARLLADMAAEKHFVDGLVAHPEDLLALANAQGAAVLFAGEVRTVGATPGESQLRLIADWLAREQPMREVYATQRLRDAIPEAAQWGDTASGMLAISISQMHNSYVLWFRPEVVQTVNWGGDPRKPAPASGPLHPRNSFEIWKETVRDQAHPWSAPEVDTAQSFRASILSIVMRKAEELAALTDELKRSNKELEAFSYSVSHDLRAPFRHIVGYAELLKDTEGVRDDERATRYVHTIIESAFTAGQLVDDLLGFSQVGRSTLAPTQIDMNRLVHDTRDVFNSSTEGRRIEWQVDDLAPAWGDGGMLRQVVQNLVGNAIKYTRPRDPAVIRISSTRENGEIVYRFADNGVGFDMAYVNKLFGVFQRLHRMEEFEGTGIGLANVRRIAERHGGRAWAKGQVDHGATFYFALPDKQDVRT
ncbi:MAG: ATP-binding protein [Bordetella sp.]|nr:ATP-binding protein [Bordetella sp.]